MASVAASGPEPMVTIKVYYDGATRRGKMPLREMVPPFLEQHIRTFLHIPAETGALIERYSDSAAAYVLLDAANVPVYKQLYRAAKAKSKLKFRVTLMPTQEKAAPKPVTVEDEPEAASPTDSAAQPQSESLLDEPQSTPPTESSTAGEPSEPPMLPTAGSETTLPLRNSTMSKVYDLSSLRDAADLALERRDLRQEFESRIQNRIQSLMERNSGLALHLEQQQQQYRAILGDEQPEAATARPSSLPCAPAPAICPATGTAFAVCCNSCEKTMPNAHYHCSTCDDGDFDLCQSCVDGGITCYSSEHWLIRRTIVNGQIVNSTTETIAPKQKVKEAEIPKEDPPAPVAEKETVPVYKGQFNIPADKWPCLGNVRTCNACIRELPEKEFLHCDTCEDFDLCQRCFSQDKHGHHPKHGFVTAIHDTPVPDHIKVKMAPGRNRLHHAICDGCDKYITGVRHKCLECPDWDYCSECVENAAFVHANHRFVPIYEALAEMRTPIASKPVHVGICCDGPLCSVGKGYPTYIRGTRYKCAVCHDLDFCANCEASPSNEHNKTHPLIKFKTPVRHVSVTTTGEHQDGKRMPQMGDRGKAAAKAAEEPKPAETSSINPIQTVVDVKPIEPTYEVKQEETPSPEPELDDFRPWKPTEPKEDELNATFVRDSVMDGSILPPNHVFEQTWVLRNDGKVSWPAGCSAKFVGGDYMGHVDSAHPAGISELVSASESTVCYAPLAPGQEFAFTVLLRTPTRVGKVISYWRLTTPDGLKFGHRLWCDVNVRLIKAAPAPEVAPSPKQPVEESKEEEEPEQEELVKEEPKQEEVIRVNNLMFPKLEKESPVSSIYEEAPAPPAQPEARPKIAEVEDVDWDATDDGFMTDEEYDILDASDEEYLEEQQKKLLKK